jgi:hypothetical protein
MLDAKSSSAMSEEGFAAWLASFGLSKDRLIQCLELGQVALERRDAVRREEEQWARQREESGLRQQELTR